MRRIVGPLVILGFVSAWTSVGKAQTSDPFFLYYSYFLPRAAAIAAQPSVNDTINANIAAQQSYAQTNRAGLSDPSGLYGSNERFGGPDSLESNGRGAPRRSNSPSRGLPTTNINGSGPAIYYNRSAQYYPSMRAGRSVNRNQSVPGRGVRGGGYSVPAATSGMTTGPR